MKNHTVRIIAIGASLASAMLAQTQRQAAMVGGGSPDRGKCTIEVVVDDVAQVEIRGTVATLRTISGQPPQWRRFECTGAMPNNPANFRFTGVDGRGRQQLVRDPRNGGVAVVQIEDKDGGAEGYTFDINWDSGGVNQGVYSNSSNNGQFTGAVPPNYQDRNRVDQNSAGGNPPNYQNRPDQNSAGGGYPPNYQDRNQVDQNGRAYDRNDRPQEQYRPNYRDSDYFRRYGHAFPTSEAVRICQQSVVTLATRRFRTNDMHFHDTRIEDNPGRQDYVSGSLDIHRGGREERYGFNCAVNFETGRVRTADLDMRPMADDPRWHQ